MAPCRVLLVAKWKFEFNFDMKAALYNMTGKEMGTIEISDEIFAREWNADLVHQAVLAQQANARRPWAHAKGRGEVSGGGKKPWKQKGTGRARHGSIRSPIWKGGGVSHGPVKGRDFTQKVNKKMARAALHAVLSKKLAEGQLKFVDAVTASSGKTKEVSSALKSFFNTKRVIPSTLLVRDAKNAAIVRSARNVANLEILSGDSMNVYALIKAKNILIEQQAVASIK
jgi:large subunit ribosomal protein L4